MQCVCVGGGGEVNLVRVWCVSVRVVMYGDCKERKYILVHGVRLKSDALCHYITPFSGHIQYISTIVKDHTIECRLTFGVQYLLDVVRIFYRYIVNLPP